MRFAGLTKKSQAAHAEIRNLSTSGISFAISAGAAPEPGQMLKVEFELPTKHPVAWFATVTRVETSTGWDPRNGEKEMVLVALKFHKIPTSLTDAISRSLRPLLNKQEELVYDLDQIEAKPAAIFIFLCAALAFCYSALAISLNTWLEIMHTSKP